MPANLRAAAYYRVSTERQADADRHSLDAQRAAFERRCAERGYEAVAEYRDVESGRKVAREAYQDMLAAARARAFDVIVVTFLDRFGRDQWEVMRSLGELRSLGVEVDAVYEDTREFVMVALSAWKAQQESKRLGERVRIAGQQAVRGGVALGVAPYGYRKVNRKLEPDPLLAPVVAGIFRAYVHENRSLHQIAMDLNRRRTPRVRSVGGWSAPRVAEIIHRAVYKGTAHWGGVTVEDAHPAIVDRDLWDAAQARATLKRGMPAGRTHVSEYLLSGISYCGYCGARMLGHRSTIKGVVYRYYICSANRRVGLCKPNFQKADAVERSVLDDLDAWLGDVEARQQKAADDTSRLETELQAVESAIAAIPSRFARVFDQFERGLLASEDQYRMANAHLDAEAKRLDAEAKRLRSAIAGIALSIQTFTRVDATTAPSTLIHDLPLPQQKAAMQEIVERIDIGDDVLVTLRLPPAGLEHEPGVLPA